MKLLRQNWQIWVLIVFFGLILIGPYITPMDPNLVDLDNRLHQPDTINWLGTDHLGRDIFSRILAGGQTTVGISVIALLCSIAIGVPIGLFAGFWGGKIDWLLMRIVDAFMAFPEYVIAIILSGLLGPGFFNLVTAILIVKWVSYARLVRGIVMQEKAKDYLLIAKLSGASSFQALRKHILPHIISPVLVLATLDIGKVVLLVASLSYIGLGVQPPHPEWGAMLNEGRPYFNNALYMMLVPGLAVFFVVFTMNLVGDQLVKRYGREV